MPAHDTYDGPWKEALDTYFPAFLRLFFPEAYQGIDWSAEVGFRDKEFQVLDPESPSGVRTVDKLVEVRTAKGVPALVLVHIEIQSQPQTSFERRMFVYHYRIFDRFDQPVVSLALLTDDRPAWRPDHFGYARWGCSLRLDFPAVKLLDFSQEDLAASKNPFSVIVQAHRVARSTRNDHQERKRRKLALLRELLRKGFGGDDIARLVIFVDWIATVPPTLDKELYQELRATGPEELMPYVTSFERIGIEKGIKKGLQQGIEEGSLKTARESVIQALETRFGSVPGATRQTILAVADLAVLKKLHQHAIRTESLAGFETELGELTARPD